VAPPPFVVLLALLLFPAALSQRQADDFFVVAPNISMPLRLRASAARGHADHGWLKSHFTFSFADYYDPRFDSFGALRVINDDAVAGGQGFGKHSHRDFEIFSYLLSGSLKHEDSLGNTEILPRGFVQFTSAGSGIAHSEHNAAGRGGPDVRFLQMWVMPSARGTKPRYATKEFNDASKTNRLRLILSPDAREDSILIGNDVDVYASLLQGGQAVTHAFRGGAKRRGYLHLPIMPGALGLSILGKTSGAALELAPGDGVFVEGEAEIVITARAAGAAAAPAAAAPAAGGAGGAAAAAVAAAAAAEFVLFDLA
jgi:redox-sensitive bicupin YhaK (pirin superfamily)